jgi:hypothetical protein
VHKGLQNLGMLFQTGELARLEIAARNLDQVADYTDVDIAEARLSKELADEAEAQVAPLHALLDFWRAALAAAAVAARATGQAGAPG